MKHYIFSAISNLRKKRFFAFINVVGLSIGIGTAVAIAIVVMGMFKIDGFHEKKDVIYKVAQSDNPAVDDFGDAVSALLGPLMQDEIPEVKSYCRYLWATDKILGFPENFVKEDGFYVDSNWFKLFSYPLKYGNVDQVLADKFNIAISEKVALQLYGDINPVGKTLNFYSHEEDKPVTFKIGGVFKEVDISSSFQFEFVIPFQYHVQNVPGLNSWEWIGTRTFVELAKNANPSNINPQIRDIVKANYKFMKPKKEYILAPLQKSNHFLYNLDGDLGGGFFAIVFMVIIGALVLFISVVDYINISVATAITRAKEISIRKVNGASRMHLILQFFTETFLVILASTIVSIGMQSVFMKVLTQGMMDIPFTINAELIIVSLIILLLTTLAAAWYPSIYMSKFNPIKIDKNIGKRNISGRRRFGVIFGFVTSSFLIAITLILSKQFNYMFTQSLGMDRFNIVYFNKSKQLEEHRNAFNNELQKMPGIDAVTFSNQLPFEIGNATTNVHWPNKDEDVNDYISFCNVSEKYASTFKMNVISGRDFDIKIDKNRKVALVNEAMQELMEMTNATGQTIRFGGEKTEIVGVIENYPIYIMGRADEPVIIRYEPSSTNTGFVRLNKNNKLEGIKSLKKVHADFCPDFILDYNFLDERYNERHGFLENAKRGLILAGFLSVFMACLGLLALTVQSTERSLKELGIRKINGARIRDILRMQAVNLYRNILIAITIAFPLVFFTSQKLLENFPLKTTIGIEAYVYAILILIGFTTLIVGWHIIRVSRRNPIEAIKYE